MLCTYNGGSYIRAQVRSILRQTLLPGVISVYDDGSTDGTVEALRDEFAERSPDAADVRLVVHEARGRRYGAVRNFERGIRASDTTYVALADQDDVWHPDRLARGLDVLDARPGVELVASNASFIDGAGNDLRRTVFAAQHVESWEQEALDAGRALEVLVRRNFLPGMTFTLRRGFVDRIPAIPAGAMHDYWLAVCAASRNALAIVPDPLVDYRIHGANAVGLDAGNRTVAERFRARARLIRSPLDDLGQWVALAAELRRDDPFGHRGLIAAKLRFERSRRFPGKSGPARVIALARLLRGDGYTRFDVGGWRGALKDFLRPRAADLEP